MWTYADLKAADPGGDDLAAIGAALNAETVTLTVDVPITAVSGYMLPRGITAAAEIWLVAHETDTGDVAKAVRSLLGLLTDPRLQVVAMTDPTIAAAVAGMLSGMVAASIITAQQQAEILALASATVPKWQPAITAGDIQTARAQP
jgi:hypothetical protein